MIVAVLLAGCGAPVLDDTFERGTDGDSTLPVHFEAVNASAVVGNDNVLRLVLPNSSRGDRGYLLIAPDTPLENYSVSARIRIVLGQARLWARTDSDLCSGYTLGIDPAVDTYRLGVSADGCTLDTLDSRIRRQLNLREWHTLRLDVRGDQVRGFIDNVEFFTETDTNFNTGIAALEIIADLSGGHLEVDRITLSQ
jgi:hypothetical protein